MSRLEINVINEAVSLPKWTEDTSSGKRKYSLIGNVFVARFQCHICSDELVMMTSTLRDLSLHTVLVRVASTSVV